MGVWCRTLSVAEVCLCFVRGGQNPGNGLTCSRIPKCGFALKAGARRRAAAPKFKGTMLMQGRSARAMQAVRDAAAAYAAGPGPVSNGAHATGAAAPPSRLKGTIVGVAAAPARRPRRRRRRARRWTRRPELPGHARVRCASSDGRSASPDAGLRRRRCPRISTSSAQVREANPLGATFAIGQESPGPFRRRHGRRGGALLLPRALPVVPGRRRLRRSSGGRWLRRSSSRTGHGRRLRRRADGRSSGGRRPWRAGAVRRSSRGWPSSAAGAMASSLAAASAIRCSSSR